MEEKEKKSRKIWKTILIITMTVVITVFIVLIIEVFWIIAKNPFNIRTAIINSIILDDASTSPFAVTGTAGTSAGLEGAQVIDEHPLLSGEQEQALKDVGVDIGTLPTSIPPALEACAIEKLGQKRVEEIKQGDVPGPLDILRAKTCF